MHFFFFVPIFVKHDDTIVQEDCLIAVNCSFHQLLPSVLYQFPNPKNEKKIDKYINFIFRIEIYFMDLILP